jgi:hypothetical protein
MMILVNEMFTHTGSSFVYQLHWDWEQPTAYVGIEGFQSLDELAGHAQRIYLYIKAIALVASLTRDEITR